MYYSDALPFLKKFGNGGSGNGNTLFSFGRSLTIIFTLNCFPNHCRCVVMAHIQIHVFELAKLCINNCVS